MVSKSTLALPIAVGAAGISLYALYVYNWKKREKVNDVMNINDGWIEHRMVLNKTYANLVIGQLESISKSSNSYVLLDKKFAEDRQMFCILMKGTPESVQEAEFRINRLIENSPEIISTTLEIPREKIKLFVGNFGDTLLNISQETGAKLFLKCDPGFYGVTPFKIEIQGPRERNFLAYNLIKQTLAKDSSIAPSSTKLDDLPKESPQDLLNASQDSKYIEVVVSAIINMNQFWVQLYRLNSTLDKMERKLADYFAQCDSSISRVLQPKLGLMLAVPYTAQGKWYRATIVSVNEDRKSSEPLVVKAMFVDYGDTEEVNMDEIRLLPEDFLHYPYFAVECCLHGIVPITKDSDGQSEWTDEALDFFESMTSEKVNKIFMARKFGDHEVVRKCYTSNGRNRKMMIPSIDLVDTNSPEDIDVAVELVARGYACWSHEDGQGKNRKEIVSEEDLSHQFDDLDL